MNSEIYIISGLGADERAFQKLDFSGLDVHFIKWIPPFSNESMSTYATRLKSQILTENPILIGLSFGGMLAVEIAKLIPTKKVVLIASAKTRYEIPFYYKIAGYLRFNDLVPPKLLKKANSLTFWLFGASSTEDKDLLAKILFDTDAQFLKWALCAITKWDNKTIHTNCIHIHGTQDRILPFHNANANIAVQNAGHLMTLNKATEISEILRLLLQ
ncbi:alpha/beta hydrolase [Sphingobacterium sp. LRF_L2]|uniref:alpha/beta hydrolase n=1 Tax=Sphingobacterium sp. LRF_L2 TaxID=3369421 RepID=UPI003F60D8FA